MYDLVDRPVDRLPTFERATLTSLRRWVHAYSMAGGAAVSEAAPFDAAMRLIDQRSSDDLAIGRPCQPLVGESEAVLIALWRLVRSDRIAQARSLAAAIVDESHATPLVVAIGASLRD